MNLRKVDLNLLTVFDAVMREGNFTRAADKIGMTQPAVSEAVARLRHLFKDDLFIRNGRGVQPTPRAHQYAAPIRRSLDLIAATLSESHTFPDGHLKLLHLWPVKLLQAGQPDYDASGWMAKRAAASLSL